MDDLNTQNEFDEAQQALAASRVILLGNLGKDPGMSFLHTLSKTLIKLLEQPWLTQGERERLRSLIDRISEILSGFWKSIVLSIVLVFDMIRRREIISGLPAPEYALASFHVLTEISGEIDDKEIRRPRYRAVLA